jgi:hypothetical protein
MTDPVAEAKEQIVKILRSLTEEERKLFSAVMQVEREHLHLEKPHVKGELLDKVREYIK